MLLFRTIGVWITMWFCAWSVWLFLQHRNINYVKAYRLTVLYFLLLSVICWKLYRLDGFFSLLTPKPFPLYVLFCFFSLFIVLYFFAKRLFDKNLLNSHLENRLYFAAMDYRFLISKSFDILFQQLAFIGLVLGLSKVFGPDWQIIFLVGIIFCAAHIPLLKTKYNRIAPYFIFASFFAGIIFSSFILSFPYGFVYSYIFHWCFYVLAGFVFNIRKASRIKKDIPIFSLR